MTNSNKPTVVHNPDENRFEVSLDGHLAVLEYQKAGKNILYTHTEVPADLESQGIGTQLAHKAMDYAQREGYKVQALCPFVNSYVQQHPEYHSITRGY